jgi:hypothetical protein
MFNLQRFFHSFCYMFFNLFRERICNKYSQILVNITFLKPTRTHYDGYHSTYIVCRDIDKGSVKVVLF